MNKWFLKYGSISNMQVAKGITDCSECVEEAVRILKKNQGKWVNPLIVYRLKSLCEISF
jgi:hypothetical protein